MGSYHSSALTSEGRLFTWGSNWAGQLGDGTTTQRNTPTKINYRPNELGEIQLFYSKPVLNHLISTIKLSVFPEIEINTIKSITINDRTYHQDQFTNTYGRIDIMIPNSWALDYVVEFTLNGIILEDDTELTLSGDLSTRTLLVEDTTPPIIIVDTDKTLIVEAGIGDDSLVQASAIDDSGEAPKVEIIGTIDWDTPGVYVITYRSEDSSGNVRESDRIIHVIPIIEENDTRYEDFRFFNFETEVYSDETDLTNQVIFYNQETYHSASEIDTSNFKPGENSAIFQFKVNDMLIIVSKKLIIEDTTPPVLEGIVNIDMDLTDERPNFLEGVTAYDLVDGDVTENIKVDDSNVDYSTPGEYSVVYTVSDRAGNIQEETIILRIIDRTLPSVDLNPSLDTISQGHTFEDTGVTVTHLSDVTIEVSGQVNTNVPGEYILTYTVTDIFNNVTTMIRIVTVLAASPTIEFRLNPAKTTLHVGETYQDTGCVALVNDEEMTCQIKENNVDTTESGVHTIIYSITYQGEEYTYTRYVFIKEGDVPLTLYYDVKRREGDELI